MVSGEMLINGQWLGVSDGRYIEVENPATEEIMGRVPVSTASNVDDAVESAHRAFKDWSHLSPEKRASYLFKAGELVLERQDEIARVMTAEQGKPLNEARGEVRKGADIFRYYAEEGKRVHGRVVPGFDASTTSYVLYQPVGTAACR